jgi:peptidoglycan/LPS O-acetylase OafA/YrhL
VDVFFVISGFLIVTLLLRERERHGDISLPKFYARRTLRIFPVYYLLISLVLLAFLLVFPWKPSGLLFYLPIAGVLITYTTDLIAMPALGVFFHCWSLAMEEQFYLVWPAMEKFFSTPVKWALLGIGLLVNQLVNFGVFGAAIDRLYGKAGAHEMPLYIITFTPIILGVVLAHLLHARRSFNLLHRLVGWRGAPYLFLAAIIAVSQFLGERYQGLPKAVLHLLFMLGLASVVVSENYALKRLLTFPPFVRLGVISYGIYLYHVPVMDLVFKATHGRLHPALMFAVVTALTVGIAEISYRFFESRFLNLRNRFDPATALAGQAKKEEPAT